MFNDSELDFVVSRHNLEHYVNFLRTLKEWKRVIKSGGVMATIMPDEDGLKRIGKRGVELDSTHEHSFTMESFKEAVELIGGLKIVKLEPVIKDWSFICVCEKT
jgi:ubiquinone/menaquinone biosynthesis C-methylase UbiE